MWIVLNTAIVEKREELYASLYKKSSEIYIQRAQQMYERSGSRQQLFTWMLEEVEIVALADSSYHGRDAVIKVMTEIDTDRSAFTIPSCAIHGQAFF